MVGERKANFYRYQRDHGFAGRLSGSNAQRKIKSGRREAEAVVEDFRKGSLSGPKAMEKVTDLFKAQKINLSTVRNCARKISPNGEISPKNLSLESINRGLLFNEFSRDEGLNTAIYTLLQGADGTREVSKADKEAIKELVDNRLTYSQKNFSSKLLNKSAAVAKFTGKTTAQTAYTTSKLLGRSAKNTWNKIVGNELGYSSGSMISDEMSGSAKRSMYQVTGTMKHTALAPVTSTMRQVQLYHRMKRDTAREKEIKQAVSDVKAGKTNSEKGTTSSKAVRNLTTKLNSGDVAFKAKLGVKSKLGVVGHSAQDLGKRAGKAGRKNLTGSPASLANFSGRQMSKMTSEAFGQTDQTVSSLGSAANKLVFQRVLHPVRTVKQVQRAYRVVKRVTRVITRIVSTVVHALANLFSALLSNPIGWAVLAFAVVVVMMVIAAGSCVAVGTPILSFGSGDYGSYISEDELEDGYSSVKEFMIAADNVYTQAENDLYYTLSNYTEAEAAEYLNTGVFQIQSAPASFSISSSELSSSSSSSSSSGGTAYSNADELRQQLVDYSLQFLGCTRVTGGRGDCTMDTITWEVAHSNSPGHYEFDCSGLTQYVYLHALEDYGISIDFGVSGGAWSPESQYAYSGATDVSNNLNSIKPGDLIFFATDKSDLTKLTHVGIYIGSYGSYEHAYIEASTSGYKVKVSSYDNDWNRSDRPVLGVKRLILDSDEGGGSTGSTGSTGSAKYTADNIVLEVEELNTPYHNPYCLMSYMCTKYGQNWKMADMEYESDINNEDSIFNYQYDVVHDVSEGKDDDGNTIYTVHVTFQNRGLNTTINKLYENDESKLMQYRMLCYYYGNISDDSDKYYWSKDKYLLYEDGVELEDYLSGYTSVTEGVVLNIDFSGSARTSFVEGLFYDDVTGLCWPISQEVSGWTKITSSFGWRSIGDGSGNHGGLDIGVGVGTDICAIAKGTVDYVGADLTQGGCGYYVDIYHEELGIYSRYQHLGLNGAGISSCIFVSKGEPVEQGQVIASSGNSGYKKGTWEPYGAHFHFSVCVGTKHFMGGDAQCMDPSILYPTLSLAYSDGTHYSPFVYSASINYLSSCGNPFDASSKGFLTSNGSISWDGRTCRIG